MIKLKIIVAGAKSVGKTSLIRRYCTGYFMIDTLSTIGVDFMVKTLNIEELNTDVNFSIWDFAGENKFRQLFPSYCSGASGALLLFDITNRDSFEDINEWLELINNASGKIIKFLIASKCDLDDWEVSKEEVLKFQKDNKLDTFVETSAKTGKNVDIVFNNIGKSIIEMSMRKCPNCGELVQKEVLFCTFCSENFEREKYAQTK